MSLRERTFHVVPFFHYDVAYLRTRQEYLSAAFALLDAALRVMDADADATFLVEQPYLLQEWFAARPDALEPMRRFAGEGRLDVAPGMFVMPDLSMTAGEWLNLHVETGFRWCEDNLGLRPTVCWIPDPCNHPPTLPAWMAKCGYEAYVFSRGADAGHPNHFRWRGLDGTETLGVRMPLHYDKFPPSAAAGDDAVDRFTEYLNKLDTAFPPGQPVLTPIGGDFTAPTPHTATLLKQMRDAGGNVRFSTLPRFVAALREHWSELPVMPTDFSPMFQGTFTSRIALKRANRAVESQVDRLWRFEAAGGDPDATWRDCLPVALRHQFHDTICGTIVDAAAEETAAAYARILPALGSAIGKPALDGPRHVFNPSAEARTECVFLSGWAAPAAQDTAGAAIPVQRVEGGSVVRCSAGPLRTQTIVPGRVPATVADSVWASPACIENALVRVDLDQRGNIHQVTLKGRKEDTRLLAGPRPLFNTLSFEHDFGDFWIVHNQPLDGSHITRTPYTDSLPLENDPELPWVAGAGAFSDTATKEVRVIEAGPLRARLLVTGCLGLQRWKVDFEQTITLHAGSPRIDLHTILRPSAKFARVRAIFRPALGYAQPVYEVAFGQVEREPSEHAAINGVSLNGAQAGMILLNKGIPGNGWDGEALTLSLLRCVAMEYKGPSETGYEAGTKHEFEYAVIPFRAAGAPGLCREGARYNLPLSETPVPLAGPPFTIEASVGVEITRVERVPGGYRVHGHESRGNDGTLALNAPGGWIGPVDVMGELVDEPVADYHAEELQPFQMFMYGVVTVDA